MSKKRGTNVPDQPTVPPMPKRRRYIDESILVEKLHVGDGLPTISRSVLVNCVLPTIPTADVRENVKAQKVIGGGEHDGATCWFECSNCHGTVDLQDMFCKHCGAVLERR